MDWEFEYLPQHGVLSARTRGDLDYDMMLEFIAAVAAEMRKRACDKVLVDHRNAVLKLSPTRVYRLPAVEVAHGIDRRSMVAIVVSPSTSNDEGTRIYLGVMHANGLPHALFGDPDAALAWLLEREPDAP